MSSGGGQQTTTTRPPKEVMAAYNDLLNRAKPLIGGQAPQYDPAKAAQYGQYNAGLVAPMTPDQIQAMRSIAGTQGYTDPFINNAANMASSGGSPLELQRFSGDQVQQYMSPYLNNVMKSAVGNINETNAKQQQQVLGNAIARGAWGGDRAGVAQAELARQQGLANNATLANIMNTGYTQALGEFNTQQAKDLEAQALSRQYGIQGAQTLANIGALGQKSALEQAQAQFGAGLAGQQQQQANLSTAYQQYLYQFQYPYNQLGWLGGLISGAGSGMGGTTTANMPGASPLSSIMGIGSMLGAMGGNAGIMGLKGLFGYADGGVVNHYASGGVVPHYARGGDTWVNTKPNTDSNDSNTPSTSTWGYVAPSPQGDLTTPALNTYQNMANSGQGSYQDLMGSYNNYLKSFQMPSGSPLPMVGFAPPASPTSPTTPTNPTDPNKNNHGHDDHRHGYGFNDHRGFGRDHHDDEENYASGGLVPQINMDYGLKSKQDMKNDAEQSFGSGVITDPSTQALGSEDVLQSKAHGGIVKHYAVGGSDADTTPVDGVVPPEEIPNPEIGVVPPKVKSAPKNYDEDIDRFLRRNEVAESGGRNVKSQNSNAFGLQQMMPDTFNTTIKRHKELAGLTPMDLYDPNKQKLVSYYHAKDLANAFEKEGVPVNDQTWRMGWFLGEGGGPKFMKALASDPSTLGINVAEKNQVASNKKEFFNDDGTPKTVAQMFQEQSGKLGKTPKKEELTVLDKFMGKKPSRYWGDVSEAASAQNSPAGNQASGQGGTMFGGLFPGLDDPQRLALFKFGATMAGTPGPFGYGLAAAANAYADSMIGSKRLETESAKRAADTEKARIEAEALKFKDGAYGRQYLEYDEQGKPIRYRSIPYDQGEFQGVDGAGAGTGGQQQPEVTPPNGQGAAPESGAPQSPAEAAPKTQPIDLAGPYTGKSKSAVIKDFINEDRMLANNPQTMEQARAQFTKDLSAANDDGDKAIQNTGNLNTLAKTVTNYTDVGQKTFASGGFKAGERGDIANAFNLAGEFLGYGKNILNEKDITDQQVLNKISRIAVAGNRVGNEASESLKLTQAAYPQADQTTATRAIITAQMLAENQRRKDKMAFAQYYGSSKTGTGGYGTRMNSAFSAANGPGSYEAEKIALVKELLSTQIVDGKKQNMITHLLENPSDPKRQQAFNAYMTQHYGKYGVSSNMSRYFTE
jgi:hypothetical protein